MSECLRVAAGGGRRKAATRRSVPRSALLWPVLAALCVTLGGCAHGGAGVFGSFGRSASADEVPLEGPPEFQVLVAQELESEGRLAEAVAAYQRALEQDPDSAFLHRQVAELAARRNDLDLALGHAEKALAQQPEDEGLRLFLGTLYRFRREPENAERVLRSASGEPTSPEAAALLYGILSESGHLSEARGVAAWLVEKDPDALRSFLALADAERKLGNAEEAEAVLRRGLIRHPGELALYGALARGRQARGDREGEIAIYRELLAVHPDHHPTLLAKAEAELALGRSGDARATLERALHLEPRDVRTLLRLGFLEFEQDEVDSAIERFRRAQSLQPDQAEIAYLLAVTLLRAHRDEEAAEVLLSIGPDTPRYAEARSQLASLAEKAGDYERAIAYVEQARAVQPSRPLDIYLASLRAKNGDVAGALAFLQSLLEESGEGKEDADILYNIGIIHGEARQVDQALRAMKAVLRMDPNHAGALNYMGYTWAERGENLDEAESFIERALEQRPDDGYITDSLGWVYYMRARPLVEAGRSEEAAGLIDRARRELERASELTGGDPVISEHLGDVYLLQGDRERALELYEKAWQAGPRKGEQPLLEQKLEHLRRELGSR